MPNLSLGYVLLQTVLICIEVGIMGEAVQRLEHRYHGSSALDKHHQHGVRHRRCIKNMDTTGVRHGNRNSAYYMS